MFPPPLPLLASIEASRPVFMIVMGLSMVFIAWRMVRGSSGWTARLILSGAALLAFGYAVLVPLYESGTIERFRPSGHYHGDPSVAMAWHVVKVFAMNAGWLLFGVGFAMHARLFEALRPTSAAPRKPETRTLAAS